MMEQSTSSTKEIARFSDSAPTGTMRPGGLSEGPQIGSGCESLTDSLSIRPAILYLSEVTSGKIRMITPHGKVARSYRLGPPQGETVDTLIDLGVDNAGSLYAARRGGRIISKFDRSGRLFETHETYAPVVQMFLDTRRPTVSLQR